MGYEAEKAMLEQYIREFDPARFSSTDLPSAPAPEVAAMRQRLDRFRARMQRKRLLARNFKQTLDRLEEAESSETIITQEQIDALLAQSGL